MTSKPIKLTVSDVSRPSYPSAFLDMKDSYTVAAGYVYRFYQSLVDAGVSEEAIRAATHLKRDLLRNPDDRILVYKYIQLGKVAPELTHMPEVGLILGQRANFKISELCISCHLNAIRLKILFFILLNTPTSSMKRAEQDLKKENQPLNGLHNIYIQSIFVFQSLNSKAVRL